MRENRPGLVTSYPTADGEAPAWQVVPTDLRLEYTDGTFVGYRGYQAGREGPGLVVRTRPGLRGVGLPVGAGRRDLGDGAPQVEVTVRNTSQRDSREVVQVYLQPAEADQPVRLVGWSAVEVPPGDSAIVTVDCDARLCAAGTPRPAGGRWRPAAAGRPGPGRLRHRPPPADGST